jgi:NADH:ubiquinone oxidoreductase subunit 4 (subunit M)
MCFFLLEAILVGVFTSLDLFLFYILFEAVLIPMFFIVGIFGSRERRIRASYLLFIYTLLSSIFMLIAILFIFFKAGTTDISLLQFLSLDAFSSRVCWLAFFLSFAVKMPLVPFHI